MIPALTLDSLEQQLLKRYKNNENRIIGIMLARYDLPNVQELINRHYLYWNNSSKRNFDIFWAGYGSFLQVGEQSPTRKILNYPNNRSNTYFDLDAYIEIEEEIRKYFNSIDYYTIQLILINYKDNTLHFEDSLSINLDDKLDEDFIKVNNIVGNIIQLCRTKTNPNIIPKKLSDQIYSNFFKRLTFSDKITIGTSVFNILPSFFGFFG